MSYKIKEVQITLANGAVLKAEIDAVEDLAQLLSDLGELVPSVEDGEGTEEKGKPQTSVAGSVDQGAPEALIETRAALAAGSLRAKSVLAFKDGIPQLLRPNAFSSVSDASVALLFAVEAGLKKNSLEFDAFKGLYESQNIKSGSPVSMLVSNLKNAQYLDGKLYAAERKVRLTAKGETKAIEVLKAMIGKTS